MKHDYAHEETDRLIEKTEKRLQKEYRKAINEVQDKLDGYLKSFEIKDKKWQSWVKEGKRTKEQYIAWKTDQIIAGKRWEELKTVLAKDYNNANQIARKIINNDIMDVYALNMNYSTYEIEKGLSIDTSFTVYNHETVERIMREDPELLPPPGKKVSERIRLGKDVRWNKRIIQSSMTQSILQGESIPKMAKRLAKEVGDSNYSGAVRNARTMATGAQNAGRMDSYRRAESMGVKIKKTWLATLDGRTRYDHRQADGQTVAINEPFEVGGEELMYPGDPDGSPHLVYNCRCTTIAQLEGYEVDVEGFELRDDPDVGDMTYEEWKADRNAKSRDIHHQEKVGKAKASQRAREYRNG